MTRFGRLLELVSGWVGAAVASVIVALGVVVVLPLSRRGLGFGAASFVAESLFGISL